MKKLLLTLSLITASICILAKDAAWKIDNQQDWQAVKAVAKSVVIEDGQAKSSETESIFRSKVQQFSSKRAPKRITFKQTTAWDNWKEIDNVGMPEMRDALVLLPAKDGEYWLLGRHADYQPLRIQGEKGEKPKRVQTEKSKVDYTAGYHAWRSSDMKTWVHCGPISDRDAVWMTTAEYANGKYYLYYDKPNDQDPHLIVDDDLGDGVIGKGYGMVVDDPSNGSDCAVLRDEDGTFHIIIEDWSYNNAQKHSWDGPVARHAVSPDGIQPFKILDKPLVDERTTPTGEIGEYKHVSSKEPLTYEIHEPEQEAFGDWTAIKVGGQYYLFCDYDPVGKGIRIGRFTSDSLNKQFTWCGAFGDGHPDPSIGFAEGKFYLIQQRGDVDFISPGPWVPGVEARVGVDTNGDGKINKWTKWQEIKEQYSRKPGFARVVDVAPAAINLNDLPEGQGFAFQYKTNAVEGQDCSVVMEQVQIDFM